MSSDPPIDEAVRARIADELDRSFALVAGAGAGKTSVLVERIVHALGRGCAPTRVAAITFTEKAASELIERVRDGLEGALEGARTPRERRGLEEAIASFDELTLSTIHSFCADLLRREALAAGWAPEVELDASAPLVERAYEAWRRSLDARLTDEQAVTLRLHARERSYRWGGSIHDMAMAHVANRDLAAHTEAPGPLDLEAQGALARASCEAILEARTLCQAPETCKLYGKAAPTLRRIEALLERLEDPATLALVLLEVELPKTGRSGRKGDWRGDGKAEFNEALDALRQWQEELQSARMAQLHHELSSSIVEELLPAIASARAQAGVADFSDLLFESAQLLAQDPRARARLAARFDMIFIDEVQDTDPIQAEVAALLTRPDDAEGPWDATPPLPGRLFAVGDPNQSIYRFRRADIATWRALQDLIARDGEVLRLEQNFRSVPGIVRWVNATFAQLPDGSSQAPYRPPAALDPIVQLEPGGLPQEQALARHLHELVSRSAPIVDRHTGQLRPIRWGDVMILLPSWMRASRIQDHLAALGVDVIVEGGRSFFERDEVRFALAALRAIDDPFEGVAITATLRGVFGFDHEALASHRADGGSWSHAITDQPEGPIAQALEVLRRLHEERSERSLVELLDELLWVSRAEIVWAMMARGRAALANLDKLRTIIRELELAARTPGEVLEQLEEMASGGVEELVIHDEDLDAVRITTYFKAKGREAPLVALLHADRQIRVPDAIPVREAGELVARASKEVAPLRWDEFHDDEKEELREERRRWMYVACTRARDQLVIVPHEKSNLLEQDVKRGLIDEAEGLDHDSVVELEGGAQVAVRHAQALAAPPRIRETFPGRDALVDALLEGGAPPLAPPPEELHDTQQARAIADARRASTRWRAVVDSTWKEPSEFSEGIGLRAGALVHQVLEHLDLSRPCDELVTEARHLCEGLARGKGLEAQTIAACGDVLEAILTHPIMERARQAPERWREVPFTRESEDGSRVSGRIDLCFPLDDERRRWMIVDWKSYVPAQGTDLRRTYEAQLSEYTAALLAMVSPCQEVEVALVGPDTPPGKEQGQETPSGELQYVHERLLGLARALEAQGMTPRVAVPVGSPIYAELELAWPARSLGVALDLTEEELERLQREGWEIIAGDTTRAGWSETVRSALERALGVELGDDEGEEG